MFINSQSTERKQNPVRSKFLTGFTLMEVVVGLIIVSVAFGGLIATFVGVKRYVSRATIRVVSTNLDRQILNSLYKDVRADTWDTGALRSSTGAGVAHNSTDVGLNTTVTIDNYNYGGANPNSYVVQNVTSGVNNMDYRQVTVTVSYPTN